MIFTFRMGPAASGADYTILIEFYSELLNHVSENWEVLARRKYTHDLDFSILVKIGKLSTCKDFRIFLHVIEQLWIILHRYHTARVR